MPALFDITLFYIKMEFVESGSYILIALFLRAWA